MTSKHDNPPAFPTDGRIQHGTAYDGMTLRDYFAGQALNGFCSQHDNSGMWSWLPSDAVFEAYKLADAMLAERNRSNTDAQ